MPDAVMIITIALKTAADIGPAAELVHALTAYVVCLEKSKLTKS